MIKPLPVCCSIYHVFFLSAQRREQLITCLICLVQEIHSYATESRVEESSLSCLITFCASERMSDILLLNHRKLNMKPLASFFESLNMNMLYLS